MLISSTGIRVGAIPLLKIRNLSKIEKYNLYQINVYEKSKKSNYKTFCTPECASIIDTYLNYRKHCDEQLKPEFPLIREQFNPSDSFKVNNPKSIGKSLIRYLVNEVLTKYSTLKQKLEYDYENKRKIGKNSTMLTHGLRKYFDTESRKAGVYHDIVELLMGHKLPGVRSHYFKPDIQTLLEGTAECKGYVAAIDALTINEENRLKRENQELKEEDQYKDYLIQQKLKQKDLEMEKMQEQIITLKNMFKKNAGSMCMILDIMQHLDLNSYSAAEENKKKKKLPKTPLTPKQEEEFKRFEQEIENRIKEDVKKGDLQIQEELRQWREQQNKS